MNNNMRKEILESYNILINDCQNNINNNVNAKENKVLIQEYYDVMYNVMNKTDEEYMTLENKIKDLYDYSNFVYEVISTIIPSKRYNQIEGTH